MILQCFHMFVLWLETGEWFLFQLFFFFNWCFLKHICWDALKPPTSTCFAKMLMEELRCAMFFFHMWVFLKTTGTRMVHCPMKLAFVYWVPIFSQAIVFLGRMGPRFALRQQRGNVSEDSRASQLPLRESAGQYRPDSPTPGKFSWRLCWNSQRSFLCVTALLLCLKTVGVCWWPIYQ